MLKKFFIITLVMILSFTAIGYTSSPVNRTKSTKKQSSRKFNMSAASKRIPIKTDSVTFSIKKLEQEVDKLSMYIDYPIVSDMADTKVQDAINAKFRSLATSIASQAKELSKHIGTNSNGIKAMATLDCSISYNKNNILSVVFQNYLYGGGAHGSYTQYTYTINTRTGQSYELKDLFKKDSDYITTINKQIQKQNTANNNSKKIPNIPSSIKSNQDFYLSNKGIVIYFNDMPYVVGVPESTIDYSLLDAILKEAL